MSAEIPLEHIEINAIKLITCLNTLPSWGHPDSLTRRLLSCKVAAKPVSLKLISLNRSLSACEESPCAWFGGSVRWNTSPSNNCIYKIAPTRKNYHHPGTDSAEQCLQKPWILGLYALSGSFASSISCAFLLVFLSLPFARIVDFYKQKQMFKTSPLFLPVATGNHV